MFGATGQENKSRRFADADSWTVAGEKLAAYLLSYFIGEGLVKSGFDGEQTDSNHRLM